MKAFFALSLLLPSLALADFPKYFTWDEVYEYRESASSPGGVAVLVAKYPEIFGSHRADQIDHADVSTYFYELHGDTVCTKQDPRAHTQTKGGTFCLKGENGSAGACAASVWALPELPEQDPCAE